MAPHPIELHAIVVTAPRPHEATELPERAYNPADVVLGRADEIQAGDLLVAQFLGATSPFRWIEPLARPSYFGMAYLALPAEFDPKCQCGTCDTTTDPSVMIRLHTSPTPWPEVCDPWERGDLLLYVPAAKLR
jgi:hypothetical protein